jgi:arabinogalactan oligomer/maltooligosaccharide transport system permease protein
LPSRLVAVFSGPLGFAMKVALLAIVNAVAIWALVILAHRHQWVAAAVLVSVTAAIDLIYLLPSRAVPAKFLIPGTFFLLAFQLIPIFYTIDVAFTNWSTGHIIKKSSAIQQIQQNTLAETGSGKTYTMAPARDAHGKLVLVLVDDGTKKPYMGTKKGLQPLAAGAVKLDASGAVVSAQGFTLVKGAGLIGIDKQLSQFTVPSGGDNAIRPQGLDTAVELHPTVRYDAKRDVFVRISDGLVFRDNNRGSFVAANKEELLPGWRTNVGLLNFSRMIHNPLIRSPFLRVFIWTIAFATLTVLASFALGLFLAITLNAPGLRFRWLYRSAIVIPYAIPGFLSLLVWQGLLNDDFGVVNRLFHMHVPWLFDPNWAKVSILMVSTWLTTPYFFLISLGALQSIPSELVEAAEVDGGGAWQVFRKVTLPLLLIAVAPLMIASFAFNFNNFGNIYLLTGGGPGSNDSPVAGATDILISYSYKIAFAAGKGQDYGLASAFSIVIFFIVATISVIAFRKTTSLENLA